MMTKNTTSALFLLLLGLCIPSRAVLQEAYLYVSDAGNFNLPPWQVLRFDVDGSNGIVFIDDHLAWPQDLLFLEDDNVVLVSNLNSGEIVRFNATTGDYIDVFASGIGGPTRMKIGPDGLVYVLQWTGDGKVRRYRTDGTPAGDFTETGVNASIGFDWDDEGNLYVSSYVDRIVKKFSPAGDDLGQFISANLAGPTNIWFDNSGDLLVNDYNAGSAKRFSSTGTYEGIFISGVPQCEGVDFLPDGDIVIGIGGQSAVKAYDSTATVVRTVVPSGTLGLMTPNAVIYRAMSSSTTRPVLTYVDMQLVTPTAGNVFHVDPSVVPTDAPIATISDISGVFVKKWNMADSTRWDASDLPNGIYYITMPVHLLQYARQSIIVQH